MELFCEYSGKQIGFSPASKPGYRNQAPSFPNRSSVSV